jgi:hypothetical protein
MRTKILLTALVVCASVAAPTCASAQVVGTGTPASCTSAAVVAAVKAGGTVTFSCGPSPVTIPMAQTAKVVNTSTSVVIDGGGLVTLSGGGANRILYMDTCDPAQVWTTSHCSQQATPQLTVKDLTFENGDSVGDGATGGGAIYAYGGSLTVENSTFVDNQCAPATGAGVGGGAIDAVWQYDATPAQIIDSTFQGNVCDNPAAGGGGGAVFESQGNGLSVKGSSFTNNSCVATGPDVGGGAIRVFVGQSAPVAVTNSTFTNNSCSNGGALSSLDASWNVQGSSFVDNRAIGIGANPAAPGTPGGGSGGAIYNDGDLMHLAVSDSLFEGNTANEGGGAAFFVSDNRTGSMSLASSVLCANVNSGFQTPGLPGVYSLGATAPSITQSTLTPAACTPAMTSGEGAPATTGATTSTGTSVGIGTTITTSSTTGPGNGTPAATSTTPAETSTPASTRTSSSSGSTTTQTPTGHGAAGTANVNTEKSAHKRRRRPARGHHRLHTRTHSRAGR